MKKSLISTLCSALVIPGLGQIVNQDLKKGLAILGAIFILFIAGIFELYALVKALANRPSETAPYANNILAQFKNLDLTLLWLLLSAFLLVWIYSIADAYVCGRRIDREEREKVS
jgi:hypothetical protein